MTRLPRAAITRRGLLGTAAGALASPAFGKPATATARPRRLKPGERVILFPFAAIPPGHPYSETGPIFVHEQPCERYAATGEYPSDFRSGRVFRAYNSEYDMIDAKPVNGGEPEAVLETLLQNPQAAFVDARSADRGCYTFRVERI